MPIFNDDAVLSIKAASASKHEGYSGTTPFTFTITRSGTLSSAATAKWAVTGGGAPGTVPASASDFFGGTLPSGLVSFAPGETSTTLSIAITGDRAVELNESFIVTLSNPSTDVTLDTASATGVVFNEDITGTGTLSIAAASASKPEGSGAATTAYTFTATRAGDLSQPHTAKWAVTGSGAQPANTLDFPGAILSSGTVSFALGQTSRTITIPVAADRLVEPAECFSVTLSAPSGGAKLGTASASGTISNDDLPGTGTLSLARLQAARSEGQAGPTAFTFLVTRSGSTTSPAIADWAVSPGTLAGTVPAGASDFVGGTMPSGTVSFAAGETSKVVTVNVAGDSASELNESFVLTLSNVPSGVSLGTTSAAGVIFNDDTPGTGSLSITRASAQRAEGHGGSTAFTFTFTVTRTGDTTASASADWSITSGGAASTVPANTADFASATLPRGRVSFTAGQASQSIVVNIAGDTAIELNESFTVTLSGPQAGVALGTASATGVILNDDFPPTGILSIAPLNAARSEGQAGTTGFTFLVTRAGTTTPGQLRYTDTGTTRLIQGNTNNDLIADLTIIIKAPGPVDAGWFVL